MRTIFDAVDSAFRGFWLYLLGVAQMWVDRSGFWYAKVMAILGHVGLAALTIVLAFKENVGADIVIAVAFLVGLYRVWKTITHLETMEDHHFAGLRVASFPRAYRVTFGVIGLGLIIAGGIIMSWLMAGYGVAMLVVSATFYFAYSMLGYKPLTARRRYAN